MIWDITMSSEESTAGRINDLRKADYTQVNGLFVNISVETSISRIESRHRVGHDESARRDGPGRQACPPEVVEKQADSQWGSKNRKVYAEMKEGLDSWSTYRQLSRPPTCGTHRVEPGKNRTLGQSSCEVSMSSEVNDMIAAFRNGTMTLGEVAQRFHERSWPENAEE